ncbi:hypothetical protein FRB96_009167 [Tulasnella sp. 330]|nr:hypothetical protein FRB96_009167 [Tulasnella sp. 330]
MSYASRHTPERGELGGGGHGGDSSYSEEAEVESALFDDNEDEADMEDDHSNSNSVLEEDILAQLNSRTLDPVYFERTALSQITERSEHTRSLGLTADNNNGNGSGSGSDNSRRTTITSSAVFSDYQPSRPPSFLAPSPPETTTSGDGRRFQESSEPPSSSSSDELPQRRPPRRGDDVSPVRRLAQFFEEKTDGSSSGSPSSYTRSASTPFQSPFSNSRSMPSLSSVAHQTTSYAQTSSYARSPTMPSLSATIPAASTTRSPFTNSVLSPATTTMRSPLTISSRAMSPVRPFASSETSRAFTASDTVRPFASSETSRPISPTKTQSSSSQTKTRSSSPTKPRTMSSLVSFRSITPPSVSQSALSPSTATATLDKGRSPFTSSVRSLVAAWKDRTTPSITSSFGRGEGLFSVRRKQAASLRRRDVAPPPPPSSSEPRLFAASESEFESSGSATSYAGDAPDEKKDEKREPAKRDGAKDKDKDEGSLSSAPTSSFDAATEAGNFVSPGQEPLRVGHLWYLNVHTTPPYAWVRARAMLYPTQLILSWVASAGGRGVVTLDLVNCMEVRSVPSPSHPSARGDIGSVAARATTTVFNEAGEPLGEFLCPFQLIYGDGVERLGAESARERVRWVGAIWDALSRATTVPEQSTQRSMSPTQSMRSAPSVGSESSSDTGSRTTTFIMPPMDTIPNLPSPTISTASMLSSPFSSAQPLSVSARTRTFTPTTHSSDSFLSPRSRATDDLALPSMSGREPMMSLGDVGARLIPPSRSSSLRRTTSMTDLETEMEPMSPRSESGTTLSLGLVPGGPVSASTGASIGRGPSLMFSPPPGPRRVRHLGVSPQRTVSDVTLEGFISAAGTSDIAQTARSFSPSVQSALSSIASPSPSYVSSYRSSQLDPLSETETEKETETEVETETETEHNSFRTASERAFARAAASASVSQSASSNSSRTEDFLSPASGRSSSRPSSAVSSVELPPLPSPIESASTSTRSAFLTAPSIGSSVSSERMSTSSSVDLKRSPARRTPTRTRTSSATDRERLSSPGTPTRVRTLSDVTVTAYGSASEGVKSETTEEITPRTTRSYRSATSSRVLPTSGFESNPEEMIFGLCDTASSFSGTTLEESAVSVSLADEWDIPTPTEYTSASQGAVSIPSSASEYAMASQGVISIPSSSASEYTTASQGIVLSPTSSSEYMTASLASSYLTADGGISTPMSESYRTMSSCPLHSGDYATASDCSSGQTAQCWCPQRTPISSTASSVPPASPVSSVASSSPLPSIMPVIPSPVVSSPILPSPVIPLAPVPSEMSSKSSSSFSIPSSVSSLPSLSPVAPTTVLPTPVSILNPIHSPASTPSPIPSSLGTLHAPAHSEASVETESIETSVWSESVGGDTSSAESMRPLSSVDLPVMPPPSIRSPVPSIMPTIPSMSSRRTFTVSSKKSVRFPSVSSASSASRSEAIEMPDEFGQMPASPSLTVASSPATMSLPPIPASPTTTATSTWISSAASLHSPEIQRAPSIRAPSSSLSVSFAEGSVISPVEYAESARSRSDRVVSEVSAESEISEEREERVQQAVSVSDLTEESELSETFETPRESEEPQEPGPGPESESESESSEEVEESEESEVIEEESEEMTSVRSVDVPNAPPGSVNRAPSIRSIRSLWATETDVSFDSTMLGPSPSMVSVALPELEVERTVSYEPSESRPSEVTISYASSSPRVQVRSAGSSLSTASTASTLREFVAVRPASSVISDWEDSFVTQSPLPSVREESERGSVSSVTSYGMSPVFVPLPASPAPVRRAGTHSSGRTITSRVTNRPSIASPLSTVVSDMISDVPEVEPPPILTHDVNRLLQYIHDVNERRGDESRDLATHLGKIEEELFDLSQFLRDEADQRLQRELEQQAMTERSDSPFSTTTTTLSSTTVSTVRVSPAVSTPVTELTPIVEPTVIVEAAPVVELTPVVEPTPVIDSPSPPPERVRSPSTLTASESYLSSHYSEFDDLETVQEEDEYADIPIGLSEPTEPTEPSESSSSSSPSTPSSSSSSLTVQPPRPKISLSALGDALSRLERQHGNLLGNQQSILEVLDDLRSRPFGFPEPESDHGIPDALRHIESFLQRVLDATLKARTVTTESSKTESEAETTTTDSALEETLLRERWKDLQRRYGMAEPVSMPPPPRPVPEVSLPDESHAGEPAIQFPVPEVDAHPASPEIVMPSMTSLYSRPRRLRARSLSPTIAFVPLPPSAPEDTVFADEGWPRFPDRRTQADHHSRRPPADWLPPRVVQEPLEDTVQQPLEEEPPAVLPGKDLDMLAEIQDLRRKQHPESTGFFEPRRPPTAPADFGSTEPEAITRPWYRRVPRPSGPSMFDQPQGMFDRPQGTFGQPSAMYEQAPGPGGRLPPVVILPPPVQQGPPTIVTGAQTGVPDMRDMMDLLRRNDRDTQASLEQQREVIRYLGDLNGWLERDARDRQADMASLAARMDNLRDEMANRLGFNQLGGAPPFGIPIVPQPQAPEQQHQLDRPVAFIPGGIDTIPRGHRDEQGGFIPSGIDMIPNRRHDGQGGYIPPGIDMTPNRRRDDQGGFIPPGIDMIPDRRRDEQGIFIPPGIDMIPDRRHDEQGGFIPPRIDMIPDRRRDEQGGFIPPGIDMMPDRRRDEQGGFVPPGITGGPFIVERQTGSQQGSFIPSGIGGPTVVQPPIFPVFDNRTGPTPVFIPPGSQIPVFTGQQGMQPGLGFIPPGITGVPTGMQHEGQMPIFYTGQAPQPSGQIPVFATGQQGVPQGIPPPTQQSGPVFFQQPQPGMVPVIQTGMPGMQQGPAPFIPQGITGVPTGVQQGPFIPPINVIPPSIDGEQTTVVQPPGQTGLGSEGVPVIPPQQIQEPIVVPPPQATGQHITIIQPPQQAGGGETIIVPAPGQSTTGQPVTVVSAIPPQMSSIPPQITGLQPVATGQQYPQTTGQQSVITGQQYPQTTGQHSVMMEHQYPQTTGQHSVMTGQQYPQTTGQHSVVIGEQYPQTTGQHSTMTTGQYPQTTDQQYPQPTGPTVDVHTGQPLGYQGTGTVPSIIRITSPRRTPPQTIINVTTGGERPHTQQPSIIRIESPRSRRSTSPRRHTEVVVPERESRSSRSSRRTPPVILQQQPTSSQPPIFIAPAPQDIGGQLGGQQPVIVTAPPQMGYPMGQQPTVIVQGQPPETVYPPGPPTLVVQHPTGYTQGPSILVEGQPIPGIQPIPTGVTQPIPGIQPVLTGVTQPVLGIQPIITGVTQQPIPGIPPPQQIFTGVPGQQYVYSTGQPVYAEQLGQPVFSGQQPTTTIVQPPMILQPGVQVVSAPPLIPEQPQVIQGRPQFVTGMGQPIQLVHSPPPMMGPPIVLGQQPQYYPATTGQPVILQGIERTGQPPQQFVMGQPGQQYVTASGQPVTWQGTGLPQQELFTHTGQPVVFAQPIPQTGQPVIFGQPVQQAGQPYQQTGQPIQQTGQSYQQTGQPFQQYQPTGQPVILTQPPSQQPIFMEGHPVRPQQTGIDVPYFVPHRTGAETIIPQVMTGIPPLQHVPQPGSVHYSAGHPSGVSVSVHPEEYERREHGRHGEHEEHGRHEGHEEHEGRGEHRRHEGYGEHGRHEGHGEYEGTEGHGDHGGHWENTHGEHGRITRMERPESAIPPTVIQVSTPHPQTPQVIRITSPSRIHEAPHPIIQQIPEVARTGSPPRRETPTIIQIQPSQTPMPSMPPQIIRVTGAPTPVQEGRERSRTPRRETPTVIQVQPSQTPMQSMPPQIIRVTGAPIPVAEGRERERERERSRSRSRSPRRPEELPPTVIQLQTQPTPVHFEPPQIIRVTGAPTPAPEVIERSRSRSPRHRDTPTVIQIQPSQTPMQSLPPQIIRVTGAPTPIAEVRQRSRSRSRSPRQPEELPPTVIQLQTQPAQLHFEPPSIIRVQGAAPTPAPQVQVPEIVRVVGERRPTPPPNVIHFETPQALVEPPSIVRVGAPAEQRITPPPTVVRIEGPAAPTPQPPVVPSVVRITSPPRPSRSRSPPPPQQIQVMMPEPSAPTVVRIEAPSVPMMAPSTPAVVRIHAPTPATPPPQPQPQPQPPVMIPMASIIRIDASAVQRPVVEVEAPAQPETALAPTIIQVPGAPAPQELPTIMRFGTSMSHRPIEGVVAPSASTAPATPAIVRIQGMQPPTVQQVVAPSIIRITSPSQHRATPIVVARAPRDTTLLSPPPGPITQPFHGAGLRTPRPILQQETGRSTRIVPTIIDVDGTVRVVTGVSSNGTFEPAAVVSGPSFTERTETEAETEELPPPPVLSPTSIVTPRPSSGTSSSDFRILQERAEWQEEQRRILAEEAVVRRQAMVDLAEQKEQERQAIFDHREAEREQAFLEAEQQRQQAAEERREELFKLREEHREHIARTRAEAREETETAVRHSIAASAESIEDVLATSAQDRESIISRLSEVQEEAAAEREAAKFHIIRLGTKVDQEHGKVLEEQRERIRMLEEELQRQRETTAEQMQRFENVEAKRWDGRRQQDEEQHSAVQSRLNDITNILQDRAVDAARWRELDEERLVVKEQRRAEKAERMQTLHEMINDIIADREEEKRIREEERAAEAAKPGIEAILEAINRQNAEQALLMSNLVNDMRADCHRRHVETLEAVRATAGELVPFNVQHYLDEFSKALSSEVRLLLKEVGKLREEKRALQHEIGCLLCMKSKYGPGGEFDPDWVPHGASGCTGAHSGAAPHTTEVVDSYQEDEHVYPAQDTPMVKPAWREQQKKKKLTKGRPGQGEPFAPIAEEVAPAVALGHPHPASWASWKPNPMLEPSPVLEPPPTLAVERTPGLFGPRSPRSSYVS